MLSAAIIRRFPRYRFTPPVANLASEIAKHLSGSYQVPIENPLLFHFLRN